MHNNNSLECKWIISVENNLNKLGLSNVWLYQGQGANLNWLKNTIKQRLFDQSQQNWIASLNDYRKCVNYKIFKNTLCYEPYLNDLPSKFCKSFTKYRCSNHKLPVEIGSYSKIPRNERICNLCNVNQLGDEYHYVIECKYFALERRRYIKTYYISRPSSYKFAELFNVSGEELVNLCKFISHILETMK